MQLENKKYLALDIGITSLGWAISEYNNQKNNWNILDFGVRLWDAPEDSKSLDTKVSERRQFRSGRRLNSRKKIRINDLKKTFYNHKLLKEEDYQNHFLKINKKGKKYFKDDKFNPIILRKKGLEEKLTNLELLIALINIAKRRGYSNRFLIPNLNENKDARKSIEKSKELIKKYKYPIKAITEDPFFNFNPKDLSKFNYRSRVFNESKFNGQIFLDKNKKEINTINLQNLLKKYNIDHKNESEKELIKILKDTLIKKYNDNQILFNREDYENEFDALLNKQIEYNDKLSDIKEDLKKIIFRQRDFEDGPGPKDPEVKKNWKEKLNKDSKQFYYKQFFENLGNCEFFQDQKRLSCFSIENDISFILNETGKIFSKLKNEIQINSEKIKIITREIFDDYFKNLKFDRKIITEIFSKYNLTLPKLDGISFANSNLFLHSFGQNNENKEFILKNLKIDLNFLNTIRDSKINKIANVLFKNKTPEKLKNELIKIDSFFNDQNDGYHWIRKNNKWIGKGNKTLSTSSKFILSALKNQLDTGEIIFEYQNKIREKNTEEKLEKLKEKEIKLFSPIKDQDMQKNSVVFRAINQVRLVVRDLLKIHNFDGLIIEVAKDLYAEKTLRNKIRSNQDKNQKIREEVENKLKEHSLIPTSKNINKYLIWKDQQLDSISKKENFAYDLYDVDFKEIIYLKDFIEDKNNEYQVDHIAPYSLVNDDTKNNKIVTSRKNNALKNNKTPLDFFKAQNFNNKQLNNWKNKIEKNINSNIKLAYLFMENLDRSKETGFESRNINDTRYITKYITDYLKLEFAKKEKKEKIKSPKILQIQGGITSYFRRLWLNPSNYKYGSLWGDINKPRDISPFHHAVDAIILSNMISEQHIEFYQLIVRIINFYNYYVNKKDSFNIKEKLFEQKRIIDNRFKDRGFIYFYGTKELNNKLNQVFNYLIDLINQKIKTNQRLERIDFTSDQNILNLISPLIENLPSKINNLIPVKLKQINQGYPITTFDSNTNEYIKEIKYKKIPAFLNTIEATEWANLNNKNIKDYPYVSYKIDKRIRGTLIRKQNPSSKKEAIDNKTGKLKDSFIKDKSGNFWDISKYIGYTYDQNKKLIPIYRNKVVEIARKKERINLILFNNAQFRLSNYEIIYTYNCISNKGKIIVSANSNLKYENPTKFKKIFDYWPNIGITKAQDLKLVNITRLGKIQ
ncbi:type II CRISPR RNA-guided endonuclease Cas9 [Candidatus Hepatoplasma crinochetorum]|uniref:type II CRISPR RNA-guided endonuclease Cas9 n=1 Tax=Candidatus Hepatoplasma crinochetorum TaxID=295596 RepID=UPI0030919ACE|nr:MAG: hypothetical protein HCTKY_2730 [Candidatus Hepatoplasma crinochetorum]